nr:LysR substrate-binding domain-containing protein [Streptomyces sp. REN17]
MADVGDIPGLPLARWPRNGVFPPGPGPEINDQTQLAQLIALGRTVAVFPESARAWLWAEHTAVPLTDAPPVVTHIAWPAHSRSRALAALVRTATRL